MHLCFNTLLWVEIKSYNGTDKQLPEAKMVVFPTRSKYVVLPFNKTQQNEYAEKGFRRP